MHTQSIVLHLLRRLLMLIPLAIAVSLVVFLLASLIPGGPVAALLAGKATDTATIEAMKARLHLNEPLHMQYFYWISGVVRGDFGTSIFTGQPVAAAIGERIWITLVLNLAGVLLCLLAGGSLGIAAAVNRGSLFDRAIVAFSLFLSSAPPFVLAIAGLYFLAYKLGWFPLFGLGRGGPLTTAWHLVLPAIIVSISPLGFITKMVRAAMIDQLDQDYVTFARARGIPFRQVLFAHAFRNAMVPVLTAAGLLFVGLLTGTVFVETVFGIPGMGRLLVTAVQFNDFPVMQGVVLFVAAWIVLTNLVIDLLYTLVDPRVQFGRASR
ncbi:MAG: ABC transporter permease [Devosia sp.]|uniref:ABC transporter permease n=1 Tax=Devosia sp. TaxID=1871048 RepID=UPI001A471EB4|nr:ABC transporter permease [Devosia sp.]MBL8598638.1 ABC transporter permease [Devosia sp.]